MRQLEDYAVEQGTSKIKLMGNTGKQTYCAIKNKFDLDDKRIVIFAGPGNNGGDGFAAAKSLASQCPVIVFFFGDKENLSEEAEYYYKKIRSPINLISITEKSELEAFRFQKDLDLILIDALLGTGAKGPLRNPIRFAVDYFNSLPGTKISLALMSW